MELKSFVQATSNALRDFFSVPEELSSEVNNVLDANEKATATKQPQEVNVAGKKVVITDDGAGRQATTS